MSELIGKDDKEIEKEFNFNYYVEFKPKKFFGFDKEEHAQLMNLLIKFLPKTEMKIFRLDDGIVNEVFNLNYEEVVKNINLIINKQGKFYEESCEISYAILTENFFATVIRGMVFWSSGKELAEKWNATLKKHELDSYGINYVGGYTG